MLINKGLVSGGIQGRSPLAMQIRVVGKDTIRLAEFRIDNARQATTRVVNGKAVRAAKPFFVDQADQPFHYGGNSLCYALQWAALMGADPIYLMGFTLQSGTPYDFGQTNPVTKKPSFYRETWRSLEWLRAFEERWPGRARLLPGWVGPVYDVFQVDAPRARIAVPWLT